ETGALQLDLRGLPDGFERVGFRSDGARLLALGSGTIQEWDVSANRDLAAASWPVTVERTRIGFDTSLPLPAASLLALSEDGSRVAVVALDTRVRPHPEVTVLDTRTGRSLARDDKALPRNASSTALLSGAASLTFSPDGARLAAWPKRYSVRAPLKPRVVAV